MVTKGVFLTAYGKRGYVWSAYNLAFSIKYFNPHIKITLYHDDSLFQHVSDDRLWVFDELIHIPDEVKFSKGKIDPAKIKVSVYDLLPYDYNLYLDVDALALKDLAPIFTDLINAGGYYYTTIIGTHTIQEGADIGLKMIWADADVIWDHFKLPSTAVMPCTNSSFQFIKKCEESKSLFDQLKKNLEDPIPLNKLKNQWGGGQPDELYLNVALAQKGLLGKYDGDYLFLGYHNSEKTFEQITNDSYILSVFGGRNFTRLKYTDWYERLLHKYHREQRLDHHYKYHLIIGDKHANTPPSVLPSAAAPMQHIPSGLSDGLVGAMIPINKTMLIDPSSMIHEYRGHLGRPIHITNWCNCSFIEFKGKRYLCYRMEAKPFCVSTRLGMCLLDEYLQPIEGSSVLLEVHSDLSFGNHSFGKGYHVEDPRLFIHRDELYLSYTDGYTMGQAKINPDTLQAEESFYLDKPDAKRTEKNWTFFESKGKLYSIYDTSKQTVYEMNGHEFKQVSESPFEHGWQFGELRGGTSPIKVGNTFLSFFHSSKMVRYRGRDTKQYFVGAYTFEDKFPFKVISISTEPIVSGELIAETIPRFNNKIYVVFPGGVIEKKDSYFVSFGFNDTYCRYFEINKELLKKSMVEVKQVELAEA